MTKKEAEFHGHLVGTLNEAKTPAEREQVGAYLEAFTSGLVCYDCSGSGKQNCNRYFCGERCGVRLSEKEGYCPDHQELAGHKRLIIREQCEWLDQWETASGKCLRRDCPNNIAINERVLYFPQRNRAMDVRCGEEYMQASVVVAEGANAPQR